MRCSYTSKIIFIAQSLRSFKALIKRSRAVDSGPDPEIAHPLIWPNIKACISPCPCHLKGRKEKRTKHPVSFILRVPLLAYRFSTDSHRVPVPSRFSPPHAFIVSSSHVIACIHPVGMQHPRPHCVVLSIKHRAPSIKQEVPYREPSVTRPRYGEQMRQGPWCARNRYRLLTNPDAAAA